MVFLKNQLGVIWATKAGSFQRKSVAGLGWCWPPNASRALQTRLFASMFRMPLEASRLMVAMQ
ncbi:hypothetical protein J2Z19_006142 [Ensifer adhaerens]|uniref:Uncharacterized protein n=1 Tax=Ensifer adhaerens TaxID=106592 RepID=A0ACC5T5J2_ENSAD|nr:hypothetical protein [Ensifer adhaerens]MBP1876392.1 hypothetical protein [Ensifer adhaerens]